MRNERDWKGEENAKERGRKRKERGKGNMVGSIRMEKEEEDEQERK